MTRASAWKVAELAFWRQFASSNVAQAESHWFGKKEGKIDYIALTNLRDPTSYGPSAPLTNRRIVACREATKPWSRYS
jgi:hypothetical protein